MHDVGLLPLAVAIPLGAGFLIPLVPKRAVRAADALGLLAVLGLGAVAVWSFGRSGAYEVGGWAPPVGIVLNLDGLSWLMLAVIAGVSLCVVVYSVQYMDAYTARGKFYGLLFLMIAGMCGVVLTGDLFNMYVFLEIAAIASYALVAFGCEADELEASFKYAVLGSVASALILLGIALLYSRFATVNMAHLAEKLAAGGADELVLFAEILIIAGLSLKAALVPFHAWLPDAHPSAPAPISAMLSGVVIKALGVYPLVRIMFSVFGAEGSIAYALMVLGALSMAAGGLLAIGQADYKRLLAYSSISQIGYVVLGLGLGLSDPGATWAHLAVVAGLFHLANHAVFKSLLFLGAGAVEHATGTRRLDEMGGLRERMPVTAATSLAGALSISGLPPFAGFFSKLLIVVACVRAERYGFAALAIAVGIVTLGYFLRVQRMAFFGGVAEKVRRAKEAPALMVAATVVLALACVGLSLLIVPGLRETVFGAAAEALLGPPAPPQAPVIVGL
jgi:multicomponent Na+:H+ antiporter subunit D